MAGADPRKTKSCRAGGGSGGAGKILGVVGNGENQSEGSAFYFKYLFKLREMPGERKQFL